MGNWIPTYSLTFLSGFKYGLYETNKIFVDTVYTYCVNKKTHKKKIKTV